MKLEMIDMDLALEQLGGSMKLYGTVVNGFWDRYRNVDEAIQKLIDEGNGEEARRMAHSIKGLCGNLGASSLREKALNLEIAARDGLDTQVPMAEFSATLAKIRAELKQLIEAYYE